MANYANAKATIAANIYTNHTGQVTAENVKTAAEEIVNTLIAGGYLYAGVAKLTPTQTDPGSPDANVFYIATEAGAYTNFVGTDGSLVVAKGEAAIFKYNGSWSKETTGAATAAQVTELAQEIEDTYGKYISNPEYLFAIVDVFGRLLEGIKRDGTKHIPSDLQVDGAIINPGLQEQIAAALENVIEQVESFLETAGETISFFKAIDNPEYLDVVTDKDGRLLEGIKRDGTKHIYAQTTLDSASINALTLSNAALVALRDSLNRGYYQKTIIYYRKLSAIGDSLTNSSPWFNYVKNYLNIGEATREGAAGLTMAQLASRPGQSIYDSIQAMSIDPYVDLITLWAGTNDFGFGVPLGDFDEQIVAQTRDVSTFYGAYIESVERLITLYPKARIVLIGTTPRVWGPENTGIFYDYNNTMLNGHYLKDYVDSVKKIADWFGLPFLDLYRTSGINTKNISQYMFMQNSDGYDYYLHFNNEFGSIQIGKRIASFIESIG